MVSQSLATNDRVRTETDLVHSLALCWFVCLIFGTGARLHSQELFHLEDTLVVLGIVHGLPDRTVVHKSISHRACPSVALRGIQQRLAEVLIFFPLGVRLDFVFKSRDLAIEVTNHGLDGSSRAQWGSIGKVFVGVRGHHHRRCQLFEILSSSASIAQSRHALAADSLSFSLHGVSDLGGVTDADVGGLSVQILLMGRGGALAKSRLVQALEVFVLAA